MLWCPFIIDWCLKKQPFHLGSTLMPYSWTTVTEKPQWQIKSPDFISFIMLKGSEDTMRSLLPDF